MIYGPSLKEAAYAFYVAQAAQEFLNSYLEFRLTAEQVKDLAVSLSDLGNHTIGGDFGERAADFLEEDWSHSTFDPERKVLVLQKEITE